MRPREELDREVQEYAVAAKLTEWPALLTRQTRELALDQRDLLVEIRDLLTQRALIVGPPLPYQPWVPNVSPLKYSVPDVSTPELTTGDPLPWPTATASPDSTTLRDSQSLG